MKVGDYVRNEHFGIGRINKDYYDNENKHWFNVKFSCYDDEDCHCGINENSIGFKSSPNIIDLIEVGDYVNGRKVVDKQYHYTDKDNYDMGEWCIFYENVALGDYQYDINSIVTKEQFESMEYKVGE